MIAANDCDMQPLLAMTPDQLRLFIAHAGGLLAHHKGTREAASTLRRISDRLEQGPTPRQFFRNKAALSDKVLADVLAEVETETGITPEAVKGRDQHRRFTRARRLAMWKLRSMTDDDGVARYSYPEIARAFGCDHTTVMYACREMRASIALEEMHRARVALEVAP